MCKVPQTKHKDRLNSLQVMGPKLFNSLPVEIRNKTHCSVDDFKLWLDAYLTRIPDEPRTETLTPGAWTLDMKPSNSLQYQSPRALREGLAAGWMNQLDK